MAILISFNVLGCQKKSDVDNSVEYNYVNENIDTNYEIPSNTENDEQKVTNSENNIENSIPLQKSDNSNNLIEDNNKYTTSDKAVIDTFESINKEVDVLLQEEQNETIKDKLKGTFITIVDFLFYDAKINGVEFNDLTDSAKQKVLDISKKIDNKIENKYPDYKETISDKTKKAYTKASEIISNGANNVKNFSKEKLGEENYNAIIDSKDDLLHYTKKALSIVGNVSSNLWETGKSKVKTWYENFKNNH